MHTKTALMTGATGFIGRQIASLLNQKGYQIHAITRNSSIKNDSHSSITFHNCNLMDYRKVSDILKNVAPNLLLHLAWETTHGKFWTSPDNSIWVDASSNLFSEFQKTGGQRIVAAGSCAEYQWSDDPLDEYKTPLQANTPYGKAKNSANQTLQELSKDGELSAAWCRFFFLYGPYENTNRFIPSAILHLLRGEEFSMSHGRQIRDFMHVDDAARAFVEILDSNFTGSVNIASGELHSLKEIGEIIGTLTGRPELLRFGMNTAAAYEPAKIEASINLLQKITHFKPKFNLRDGLRSYVDWLKEI